MKKTLCKDCNKKERVHGRSYCQSCFWERFGKRSNKIYGTYRKNYREERKEFIHRYKSFCGCAKCGIKDWWVLDLHHKNPNLKEFDFSEGKFRNLYKLKEEIRKCIVLCKNHHYDFHYQNKRNKITIEKYLQL